jgi:hypothetical protein
MHVRARGSNRRSAHDQFIALNLGDGCRLVREPPAGNGPA